MKINRLGVTVCALGLGALGVGGVVETASARTLAAGAGRAIFPDHAHCFWLNGGGVDNTCAFTVGYEIPLPVDSTGSKTVRIAFDGASCSAFTLDRNRLNQDNSSPVGLGSSIGNNFLWGTYSSMVMNSFGTLTAHCDVLAGGKLQTIEW